MQPDSFCTFHKSQCIAHLNRSMSKSIFLEQFSFDKVLFYRAEMRDSNIHNKVPQTMCNVHKGSKNLAAVNYSPFIPSSPLSMMQSIKLKVQQEGFATIRAFCAFTKKFIVKRKIYSICNFIRYEIQRAESFCSLFLFFFVFWEFLPLCKLVEGNLAKLKENLQKILFLTKTFMLNFVPSNFYSFQFFAYF